MFPSFHAAIFESSQVGDVRRRCVGLAGEVGFGESESGKVAIVATEIANNLVKHARDGQIFVRVLGGCEPAGIEILALDSGPGMDDVERCMRDGFSTASSPGTGLGAIARLSSEWHIYSQRDVGTFLVSRLWVSARRPREPGYDVGVVNAAFPGELVCGDAWSTRLDERGGVLLVADGLGHGVKAFEAATEAVRAFDVYPDQGSPVAILESLHGELRKTRGAAVGVARIDLEGATLRYAGVGNIGASVVMPGGQSRSVANHNGIVGHEVRKFQEFAYPWDERGTLVMWSDGLGTHWDLGRFPGIWAHHPSLIAAVLFREFRRPRDDVTVLVVRRRRNGGEP